MFAIANRPTVSAPLRPASDPRVGAEHDRPTLRPAPAPADDVEEPQTFLRILLRALGAIHS